MATIGATGTGGLRVTFAMPGLESMSVTLSRFGNEVANFTPFWDGEFKKYWFAKVARDFATEGASSGPGWAPLSPVYLAWKNKHFGALPILKLRGPLGASLTSATAKGSVWRPTPSGLEVGTTIFYGIYHQKGTRRHGQAHMPARPPLRMSANNMRDIGKLLQRYVVGTWASRRQGQRVYSGA